MSPWQKWITSRPAWNRVSAIPSLGDMVHCVEMDLRFRYAKSTGDSWNGLWEDIYLDGSSYNMRIDNEEGSYRVATVNSGREYSWQMSEHGSEQTSRDYWWRMSVETIAETELSASPPVRDVDISTSGVSSTSFSPRPDPSGHNTQRGRYMQKCDGHVDQWDRFQACKLVGCGKCESLPWGSGHQHWLAGKQIQYPPCFTWYINIQCKTNKQ